MRAVEPLVVAAHGALSSGMGGERSAPAAGPCGLMAAAMVFTNTTTTLFYATRRLSKSTSFSSIGKQIFVVLFLAGLGWAGRTQRVLLFNYAWL